MNTKYIMHNNITSFITYHFVFCPRYRRRIFDIPGVASRFKELTFAACKQYDIEILSLDCGQDYVHLHVRTYPNISIPEIMYAIKSNTSANLRSEYQELSKMPSLWTRSYFVSTKELLSQNTIDWYVGMQKKRY